MTKKKPAKNSEPKFSVTLYLLEEHDYWGSGESKLMINVAEVHQQIRGYYESSGDAEGTIDLMLDILMKGFDLATQTEGIDVGVYSDLKDLVRDLSGILDKPENRGLLGSFPKRKLQEMMAALDEMGRTA